MLTVQMLRRGLAAIDHISTLAANTDHALLVRRLNDWTTNYLTAANTQPSNTPTQIEDINGEPVTLPPLNDPTGTAALAPPEANYEQIVRRSLVWIYALERAMIEGTRSVNANERELRTTEPANHVRPGAGVCEVCDHECTGLAQDRIKRRDGRTFCQTHHRGMLRALEKGQTIDGYVTSTRAMYGTPSP